MVATTTTTAPAPTRRGRAGAFGAYVGPLLLIYSLALVLPYALMLRMTFNEFSSTFLYRETFTLANYATVLGDPFYLELIARTVWLGLVVSAIALVLGYPVALLIMRSSARTKAVIMTIALSPMLINLVVRTYAWLVILGDTGVVNTTLTGIGLIDAPLPINDNFFAVVVGLVHVYLPLMIISLVGVMDRIDPALIEAGESLGARGHEIWLKILLPLSMPGIGVGLLLVFCHAVSAFVTPALLGGNNVSTVSTVIYDKFTIAINWPIGATLVFVLLVVIFSVIFLHGRLFAEKGY
ncbi:MAG: ABC transporter permease [Salinarimonas sp.]